MVAAARPTSSTSIDLTPFRLGGAAMLALAVARPHLPADVGLPCPLYSVTGVPCPLCGLTRSVTAAVQGDLGASLAFHPLGIVAVVAALVLLVVWRWRRVSVPPWLAPVGLGLLWLYNLTLNPTFQT